MLEPSTLIGEKSNRDLEVFILPPLIPHPNADTLSLIKIGDTSYTYVGKTSEWENKVGETVAWIPPDTLVNVSIPPFSFLAVDAKFDSGSNKINSGIYARVKAKKLRGISSYGLLIPINDLSENLWDLLDLHHYEAPINVGSNSKKDSMFISNEVASSPPLVVPKYDVDAFQKYASKVFVEGEKVWVTEKLHGCFFEDTFVTMGNASKKYIKDIKSGELVKTYNEQTKKFENKEVINIIIRPEVNKWLKLTFDNGKELICTPEHKILTNLGWTEAKDLNETHEIIHEI